MEQKSAARWCEIQNELQQGGADTQFCYTQRAPSDTRAPLLRRATQPGQNLARLFVSGLSIRSIRVSLLMQPSGRRLGPRAVEDPDERAATRGCFSQEKKNTDEGNSDSTQAARRIRPRDARGDGERVSRRAQNSLSFFWEALSLSAVSCPMWTMERVLKSRETARVRSTHPLKNTRSIRVAKKKRDAPFASSTVSIRVFVLCNYGAFPVRFGLWTVPTTRTVRGSSEHSRSSSASHRLTHSQNSTEFSKKRRARSPQSVARHLGFLAPLTDSVVTRVRLFGECPAVPHGRSRSVSRSAPPIGPPSHSPSQVPRDGTRGARASIRSPH